MNEERLGRGWKTFFGVFALSLAGVAGWFFYTLSVLSHDKSLNGQLQDVWANPTGVPLGVVIRPNNQWIKSAFVADVSDERSKGVAVLILDDHYKSGDPTYRSASGLVGDRISEQVLCSVPPQASAKKVNLDAVVERLIDETCGSVRFPPIADIREGEASYLSNRPSKVKTRPMAAMAR